MEKQKLNYFKGRLEEMHQHLNDEIAHLQQATNTLYQDAEFGVSNHMADDATDIYEREKNMALIEDRQQLSSRFRRRWTAWQTEPTAFVSKAVNQSTPSGWKCCPAQPRPSNYQEAGTDPRPLAISRQGHNAAICGALCPFLIGVSRPAISEECLEPTHDYHYCERRGCWTAPRSFSGRATPRSFANLPATADHRHARPGQRPRGKASYVIQAGDEIATVLPLAQPTDIVPEDLPLSVVYEDDDVLVVNKAAGMVVHPAPGHTTGTLVNALLFRYPHLTTSGDLRPGIVHRLDDTRA